MKNLYNLDVLILVLLVVSLVAAGFNSFMKRKFVITPGSGEWISETRTDSVYAGGTTAKNISTRHAFGMDFDLRDTSRNPFASLVMKPVDCGRLNLDWADTVKLNVSYEGEQKHSFRLQVRNFEPAYYDPADHTSQKYMELVFDPDAQERVHAFDRALFTVPSWWISQQNVKTKDTRPIFDAVTSVDISTSSAYLTDGGKLHVSRIVFEGSWFPRAMLYGVLLTLWMGSFLLVFMTRMWNMRKKIKFQELREQKFLRLNKTLQLHTQELEMMAHNDALTGVLNRRGVRDIVLDAMDSLNRKKTPFSVVMVDVDHFKKVNDTEGHARGDEILRSVAGLITHRLRASDHLARWGGEEFLIICDGTTSKQAEILAESLRVNIAQSDLGITCSFGVHEARPGVEFAIVMERADEAMYRAKNEGRNRVVML